MTRITLEDLQASVRDKDAFGELIDYLTIGGAFLDFLERKHPTRIISPSHPNYVFFQYSKEHRNKITRPLNTDLFLEATGKLTDAFERFVTFLNDLRKYQDRILTSEPSRTYLESGEINRVIYTLQQVIGCIGDSFEESNQARKRIGQLFETLVKLIIQEAGLKCEPRTINIPIPAFPGYEMSHELDLVFSRNQAIVASETENIHVSEIVGSVKTTSKDRLDKVFLDKYLLTKLLGRDVPVVAVFLHDVQRAPRGRSIFGINSTFKTNHFLGYTVALSRLDGVYYIDPRPDMETNKRLAEYISNFQQFLVKDLWTLSRR